MKLLIVGLSENKTIRGVERYTLELIRGLSKNKNLEITVLCGEWQNYFFELNLENIVIKKVNVRNTKLNRHLWHYFVMPFTFSEFDIIHVINTNPILFRKGKPVVVTIHDLAEYFVLDKYGFYQRIYRRFVSWLVSKVATHIVTVSKYSKKTIHEVLSVDNAKISAIYLGVDHFDSNINDLASFCEPELDGRDYLLYWGVLERSKGVLEAIKGFVAFKKICPRKDLSMVLAGKMGNAESDISSYLTRDDIFYLGHVSDDSLKQLSLNAKAIVFPSKYEGFGFPPLEGFVFCDNVIASSTTSVGEITEKFAVQVVPEDINAISTAIYDVVKNPKCFTALEKREVLKEFSWLKCANQTYDVYEKVSGADSR